MKVDVIIPVKEINSYIYELIPKILEQDYSDFGIIIFPDSSKREAFPKTRIIPTGKVGPAQKRDLALKYSKADILAFIDDDAFPRGDWLRSAIRHFNNPLVAAVGGPAVTPLCASFWERVSGAVFLSTFGGGYPERYWPKGGVREVEDWPSVNLLVRRDVFEDIGGFDTCYWPGEDTKLCLDIIRRGKKVLYDPNVLVWHHRRDSLRKHLKQVAGYGTQRGFFAKRFPQTSLRFKYFLPSMLVIFIALGIPFSLVSSWVSRIFYAGIGVYFLSMVIVFFQIWNKERRFLVSLAGLGYTFITHICYGICFGQGFLFKRELKEWCQ